jgi:hypothetical protein
MLDLESLDLEKVAKALGAAFYAFMFLALCAALLGSPGLAFLLLILGSAEHVARVGLEGFLAIKGNAEGIKVSRQAPPPRAPRRPRPRRPVRG